MAEVYATVGDYVTRARVTLTDEASQQVAALMVDASALVRSILPAGYSPDPDVARSVVYQAVRRAIVNPGGRRYRQIGSTSEGYDTRSGLYLTDEEQEQLLAAHTLESGDNSAYTISLRDEAYPPHAPGRHERDRSGCGRSRRGHGGW